MVGGRDPVRVEPAVEGGAGAIDFGRRVGDRVEDREGVEGPVRAGVGPVAVLDDESVVIVALD